MSRKPRTDKLYVDGDPVVIGRDGALSRRDYLAGMAMQGILAGKRAYQGSVAVDAVKAADALIAELDAS